MPELDKIYRAEEIEDKWYAHWMDKNYFHSVPDDREPYSIVIPPPNVTGVLHMGHMLNNTIQDILIRRARLQGKNACWVPGTDHASIATEAKVVQWLRETQGLKKSDISRDEFLKYAWEWTDKYGGQILMQLRKLGASPDWTRTAFTLDKTRSAGVIQAFIDLYDTGKIYRGLRMINWDPKAKTVLSNEEVIYHEENARLYKLKYRSSQDPEKYIIIATQRPETIMADAAVAVHPEDERYSGIIGHTVLIPLINKEIPIIADSYVDKEFGTGALKVTPAHDINDYEIGIRHGLEVIDILNEDGTLHESAQILVGLDRFDARKQIVSLLEDADALVGVEDYRTNIGRSERTNVVVEPRLSMQWFVDMKKLADPAIKAVREQEVKFYPANQANTYFHWLENIRDWCISRQLWWGHQIPAYYLGADVFVAKDAKTAALLASQKIGREVATEELQQDQDVLDTWFSSWLWPITVFDGFSDSKDFNYYYPTSTLVTGSDIIFLWVARMIMAGYEWKNERPFDTVYFTGMVRDKQRRKMSKSLGNSPDALELIRQYGADGVRFGMLSSSPAGGDLLFDEKLCEQGRNFCNKIWNATRLILSWEDNVSHSPRSDKNSLAIQFLRSALAQTQAQMESNFDSFRLSDNLILLYSLIWDDFCSYYLEIVKPAFGEAIDQETLSETKSILRDLMVLLHPFMPFISEEIYHHCSDAGQESEDCIVATYPRYTEINADASISDTFDTYKSLLTLLRDTRNKFQMKMKDPLEISIEAGRNNPIQVAGFTDLIQSMGFVTLVDQSDFSGSHAVSSLIKTHKVIISVNGTLVDTDKEREKILEQIAYYQSFIDSISKKLSNERFVNGAPANVVEMEKKKLADSEAKIAALRIDLGE